MSSCLGCGGGRACHMELPLHGHICAFVETGFIRGTVRIVAQWDESSAASYARPPFAHQMSTQHEAPMCTGAHGFGAAPTLADEEGHEDNKATGSAGRVTGAGASCVLDPVYLEELRAALAARGAWDDGAGEEGGVPCPSSLPTPAPSSPSSWPPSLGGARDSGARGGRSWA